MTDPNQGNDNMNNLMRHTLTVCFFFTSISIIAEEKNSRGGFLDFNVYPYLSDVGNDSVFTLNIGSKLNGRFSYFSLINFQNQDDASELEDTVSYYSEHNVRWKIGVDSPFDLTAQFNIRGGEYNDRHRLGFRWRLSDTDMFKNFFKSIHLFYAVNFHLIQFDRQDADARQIEHVFSMKFPSISDRLYLSGFIDHTFNEDLPNGFPSSPIVGEAQLGYRVYENFFLIAEYRVNQYRRSDVNNLAIGFQYKINW